MLRHKKSVTVEFPDWYFKLTDNEDCLRSVVEDAYYAQQLALKEGAGVIASCEELMTAGEKSLKGLGNRRAAASLRCREGDRAARKFWEAKVCARRRRPKK